MIAVGYQRVSTAEQGEGGLGLGAQTHLIGRAVRDRRWTLERIYEDIAGAGDRRPSLAEACDHAARVGGALVVARLDRLSRSVGQFAGLMDQAQQEGWQIVCLDPAVDMTTPYGRAMAGMAAVFAQLERELIGQRTREGLEEAKRRGSLVGRPRCHPHDLVLEMRRAGFSHAHIGRELGIPASTVGSILRRRVTQAADESAA